jgi:bifunctional non-homologous end joining protein LigD
VKPEVVVSVRFGGWTGERRLRHPVFRGIRKDVKPEECTTVAPRSLAPSDVGKRDEDALEAERASVPGPEADEVSAGARVEATLAEAPMLSRTSNGATDRARRA